MTFNQSKLVYWILERESVRKAKEQGLPAPWSTDPIMQSVYFCNVNREYDKVTSWIRNNWSSDWFLDRNHTLTAFVARVFNLPSTLELIGKPCSREDWFELTPKLLKSSLAKKQPIYNGAYMITTASQKIDKTDFFLQSFTKLSKRGDILQDCTSLAQAHKQLLTVDGIGSFMAAQVVADLKNTEDHPLSKASDWKTFSAFGPGSLRGLSWFWEKDIKPKDYQNALQTALDQIYLDLPEEVLGFLCMQNFQNCLCEYDKYMRVLNGKGRSKRNYNGRN